MKTFRTALCFALVSRSDNIVKDVFLTKREARADRGLRGVRWWKEAIRECPHETIEGDYLDQNYKFIYAYDL